MANASTLLSPLTILVRPVRTVRGLLERSEGEVLAWIVAAAFGVVQSARVYLGSSTTGPGVVFAGAALGVLGLFFFGWLLRNFSRWFGGSPALREVRIGFGLGLLPWTVLFAVLLFSMPAVGGAEALAGYFSWFIVAFFYGYIILLLATTAALRISVLKTFLTLTIAAFVSFFPITLIAQLLFAPAG